ncbi:hypothetical protein WJX81_000314 [Elliptochloris bilobata]|uniref:Mannosyl phosphorylinositol ceramide synthase SUR1 n=1 Tax=Elliptochloris bilobata TaxID=381761 RepID=A0AAW1QUI0_9CHLO
MRTLFHPPHRLHRERDIPRIIHQSWKTSDLPANYARWSASWREKHPTWEYMLWTNEENDQLVHDHYPWFRDTFDALPAPVMKADACRYLYMHHFGGVYADLDFEALRDLGPLLAEQQLVLAAMSDDQSWDQSIPNAWLASARRHPFWLFTLAQILKAAGRNDTARDDWIEATTGPVMLHAAVASYRAAGGVGLRVLSPGIIYPINWMDTTAGPRDGDGDEHSICNSLHARFNDTACKSRFPEAYAITYWTHSWGFDHAHAT